jgi:leucyl/phenylalanyl-tRNA--protein transferase
MVALTWLAPGDPFPPTRLALSEPDGLLAAGGDLSLTSLLQAYRRGIFPWFNPGDPILWWTPDPRMVLFPERFHASRRLRRRLRNTDLLFSLDQAFERVMRACAAPRAGQPGTWISRPMLEAYTAMHEAGHAHSVEVWQGRHLVGGVYGIMLGSVFFGESMFSRVTDASKSALWFLCALREHIGMALLDAQVASNHVASLGGEDISRDYFETLLDRYATSGSRFPAPAEPAPLSVWRPLMTAATSAP